jgi:hypothetical protein
LNEIEVSSAAVSEARSEADRYAFVSCEPPIDGLPVVEVTMHPLDCLVALFIRERGAIRGAEGVERCEALTVAA